jgi:hypothetical protein
MLLLMQDCACAVALYPFKIEPLEDLDPMGDSDVIGGGDVWNARPLLFFTCSSLVPYAPLIAWVMQPHTRTFHWYSSTPLNQSV